MNPYQSLPARAFWRTGVAEPAPNELGELWTPKFGIGQDEVVITAGSCFARHIGRALTEHGLNWRDAEPAPPGLTGAERAARNFGIFSFRTGNIYTAAVLRQWFEWALGESEPPIEAWQEAGRYFDPFRPSIEPAGYPDVEAMLAARRVTLAAIGNAVTEAGCFVFTLGLTEAWQDVAGTTYPACPGTVRGRFDAGRHRFANFSYPEVYRDLSAAIALAHKANPALRIVLTVSPQPLTATAAGGHALTANTYSKSVLRAVAGQLAAEHEQVDYFPAYELITGIPFRSAFFEPNLRTVTPEGVQFVMRYFIDAVTGEADSPVPASRNEIAAQPAGEDFLCDDAVLDYYAPR